MNTQELADRAAIGHTLSTYFRGIDRYDLELVRSCFFEDAEISLGPGAEGPRDEILELLGSAHLSRFKRTVHFAGNTIIELDGDTAHTEVYAIAYHSTTPAHEWGEGFVTVWLRYVDRFERRAGEWGIARRKLVLEWLKKDDASLWDELPGSTRDGDDPVYVFGR